MIRIDKVKWNKLGLKPVLRIGDILFYDVNEDMLIYKTKLLVKILVILLLPLVIFSFLTKATSLNEIKKWIELIFKTRKVDLKDIRNVKLYNNLVKMGIIKFSEEE